MQRVTRNAFSTVLRAQMALCGTLLVAMPAFGATTGSVTPRGTVPSILEVTVTPTAGFNSLDLTTSATDVQIAQVNERTNNKAGYTISLDSTNGIAGSLGTGRFKSTDVTNTDTLDYTIKYAGNAAALTNGSATVTDSNSKTTGTGVTKAVQVSYDGSSLFMAADTYEDTLTFTITAK